MAKKINTVKPVVPTTTDNITVTLTSDQWTQLLGMTEQGVSVLLSQLSMQQGGLSQVAQLSAAAESLLSEIKQQVSK